MAPAMSVLPSAYRVEVSDVVVLHHLPGVGGVADVLEVLGGVGARILDEDLLSAGMLHVNVSNVSDNSDICAKAALTSSRNLVTSYTLSLITSQIDLQFLQYYCKVVLTLQSVLCSCGLMLQYPRVMSHSSTSFLAILPTKFKSYACLLLKYLSLPLATLCFCTSSKPNVLASAMLLLFVAVLRGRPLCTE
jgi:hypothetical protein